MKLYKYIDFNNPYWSNIGSRSQAYFASVPEVTNVNDPDEFRFDWDSSSHVMKRYFRDAFEPIYTRLYLAARVFCTSKSLSRVCWDRFCNKSGTGVCYEFIFDESKKSSLFDSSEVTYSDEKIYNVPQYIMMTRLTSKMKKILSKQSTLNQEELTLLKKWNNRFSEGVFHDHINKELAFKKKNIFADEDRVSLHFCCNSFGGKEAC